MATGLKRTYVVEAGMDPDTGGVAQDREKVNQIVSDLLGSLWTVGGAVRIVADRVHVGDLPPDSAGGRPEPLGETVGMVIEYQASTPLNKASLTARLLDEAMPELPAELVDEPAARADDAFEEATLADEPADADGDEDEPPAAEPAAEDE
jgi:hypothetical protein